MAGVSLPINVPHTLGLATFKTIAASVIKMFHEYEEHFTWLDEIAETCAATFSKPNIEPLPKTPSAKRGRGRLRSKRKTGNSLTNANSTNQDERLTKKKTEKQSDTLGQENIEPTRPQRATRNNTRAASKSKPVLDASSTSSNDVTDSNDPPTKNTKKKVRVNIETSILSSPQTSRPHDVRGNVMKKALLYEDMVNRRFTDSLSPCRVAHNISKTSKHEITQSPSTLVKAKYVSSVSITLSNEKRRSNTRVCHTQTSNNLHQTPVNKRVSLGKPRKSLKMCASATKLLLCHNRVENEAKPQKQSDKFEKNSELHVSISSQEADIHVSTDSSQGCPLVPQNSMVSQQFSTLHVGSSSSSDPSEAEFSAPKRQSPEQSLTNQSEVLVSSGASVSNNDDNVFCINSSPLAERSKYSESDSAVKMIAEQAMTENKPCVKVIDSDNSECKVETSSDSNREHHPIIDSVAKKLSMSPSEIEVSVENKSVNRSLRKTRSNSSKEILETCAKSLSISPTKSLSSDGGNAANTNQIMNVTIEITNASDIIRPISTTTETKIPPCVNELLNASVPDSKYEESLISDCDIIEKPTRKTRTKRKVRSSKVKRLNVSTTDGSDTEEPKRYKRTKTRKKKVGNNGQTECENISNSYNTASASVDMRTTASESCEPVVSTRSSIKTASNARLISQNSKPPDDIVDREIPASRVTRSKLRVKKPNVPSQESSGTDDVFGPLTDPAPKAACMKRKLSKSGVESDTQSKRSCLEVDDMTEIAINSDVEPMIEDGNITPTNQIAIMSDEFNSESDNSYMDDVECPPDKVIRPHPSSFLNAFMKNRSQVSTPSMSAGIVKSFIKRNTPVPMKQTVKERNELRKKELQAKERKNQEILQRREQLLKEKIEQKKRIREDRMKRAAETREQKEIKNKDQKDMLAKKMDAKQQMTNKLKVEKLKEDKERQRLRLKKQQEAEDRRKFEEDERLRKLQDQEEEERRHQEMIERKKEFEDQERINKIAEEKRKMEERLAEVERERLLKADHLRLTEEEKDKERQRQREIRDKVLAKDRADKQKAFLEKQEERSRKIREELEAIKEMGKQRQLAEAARREELRKEEDRMNSLIKSHNTSVQMSKSSEKQCSTIAEVHAKPILNTTYNPDEHSDHNKDSYEMTPKTVKLPSTTESYNIDDIRSDDETDDEDAPRKKIPHWAQGAGFQAALINQSHNPPDIEKLFGPIYPPELNDLFKKKKPRFNKRTSSALWDSPLLKEYSS